MLRPYFDKVLPIISSLYFNSEVKQYARRRVVLANLCYFLNLKGKILYVQNEALITDH